ncbi:2Fe-2S iron-sulfur cluster-binding protein [Bacillus sp. FJAT-45350]|uniref:2Fe-2S iron-sulfur cluster-binding protein n=1 Tax=Bacillus sp. FJAT-45350 TaxID=2011014 RepID=UPI000BB90033|nr:2Fe-2S iron-sulfur cluster-binding protein [Bacillus sp. FJAT-45350]
MPVILYKNVDKKIEVPTDSNILRTSLRYDGALPNKCGGGFCGTCVIKIEEGSEYLDKIKPAEHKKLGEELLEQGYRLGCQTFISGDVTVSWDDEITKQVQRNKVKINR